MKKYLVTLFLLLPAASPAQNEADKQMMRQQMEQVKNCMANVDRSQLMQLEQRSRVLKTEIDLLCAQGKREEAQKKAIAFGKEVAADNTMKTLAECSAMMGQLPPKLSFRGLENDTGNRHICDF